MTKEEKIKEAYGQYYEEMKPFINEKGWFDKNAFYNKQFVFDNNDLNILFMHKGDFMIPNSIYDLENNNGWIKIESEADLPKEKTIDIIIDGYPYQGWIFKNKIGLFCHVCNRYVQSPVIVDIRNANSITHYQPIIKPDSPLY